MKLLKINRQTKHYEYIDRGTKRFLSFATAERQTQIFQWEANQRQDRSTDLLTTPVRINDLPINRTHKPSKEAFKLWSSLYQEARDYHVKTRTQSRAGLSLQLLPYERDRIEVITDYGEIRRFWVGKTTGWMPCHLEVLRTNSMGGTSAELEYKAIKLIRSREP